MLRNYLIVAWRNIWKNKTFSFINLLGLGLGMACSLLILLWVQDERSMDAFHRQGDRLYSIYERQYYDGKIEAFHGTPGILGEELKKVMPEIQFASPYGWLEWNTFAHGDKIIKFEGSYAGADFFSMFSFPLLEGKAQVALNSPDAIAISKKMAGNFFGSAGNAIGKTIRFQDQKDLTIKAVFEDVPATSSKKFDYLINWYLFLENNSWAKEWGNNGPRTYVTLRAGSNAEAVEKKLARFLDTYNKEQDASFRIELGIQRFNDMYLHSHFEEGKLVGGRIEYVRLFSLVALFILVIACINFMNLTTARSLKRAKEIGVRKVVGAVKFVLMRQFIGEAILLTTFAVCIALLLVALSVPAFNELTGKQIGIPLGRWEFWLNLVLLTLLTGLISGSYPALFLSSFNPVAVLKGAVRFSSGATLFRKGLVVFQFILTTVLIIGTIIVYRQVEYIQTKNTGYSRENLLYLPVEGELRTKYAVFKDEAGKSRGIKDISRMSQAPTEIENGTGGVEWDGKDPSVRPMFTQASIGYDFVKTMKLQLAAGRDFSRDFASDSSNYLINESALQRIGYRNPIGKPLTMWGKKGVIVGVVKDFHFNSLRLPIKPLIMRFGESESYGTILVRVEEGRTPDALAELGKLSKQLNPKFPFTYQFSDEEYGKLYLSEQLISRLSKSFAILAIFISCLGLLGLAIFTAEQRTKEIGIRKVLGASVHSLFALLSKEFLLLVLIALAIASPLAWYAMNRWLQDYTYRAEISGWAFAVAGLIAICIALLTISFHAIKAAIANPVKSLRTE